MYADYSYYADHYGGDIPEREYPSAERRAEAYIRKLTYVRGDIFAVENTAVKDAVCAVADVYYSCKKKQEAGTVKSENNDGYSVSYAVEQADGQTIPIANDTIAYRVVWGCERGQGQVFSSAQV